MKKTALLLWLFILGLPLFQASARATEIEGVRSYRAPDHVRLVFDLSNSIDHQIFTLENPARIVIDLKDTDYFTNFSTVDLSNTPINSIRSAERNANDLRVVLDMNSSVQPRSFSLSENTQYGDRLVVDLFDQNPTQSTPQVVASAEEIDNRQRDIVVAISAGHGGDDPGAIGVNGLKEKTVVLSIANQIKTLLEQTPGYRPVMVREDDYYVDLRQRTRIAHDHNADLFIAIHADAFTSSGAQGATVYALSQKGATSEHAKRLEEKENGADLIGGVSSVSLDDKDEMLASVLIDLYMTASIATSVEVGNEIISSLGDVTRMRRSTVEQAAFVVLMSPDIPSLLIEAGYITNPTDARNLNSSSHQRKFAGAVVDGITRHFFDTPPRGSWIAWQKEHSGTPQQYTVSRGDNLSQIAERFGVSLSQLKIANGLSNNTIHVGQNLVIPNYSQPTVNTVSFVEHTISRGETLSGIASDYHVSLQRIRETNQINSDTIRIGQVIRIPSS